MAPKRDIESSNESGSDQSEVEEDGSSGSESDDTGTISETHDSEYGSHESLNESEDVSTVESVCSSEEVEPENNSLNNHSYEKPIQKSSEEFKKKEAIIPESSEGGVYYYKSNCCPYCEKIFVRLDRHLLRAHMAKKTVRKIASLPLRLTLRMDLFSLLANIGNERFNKDEIRNPTKRLFVKRRSAKNRGKKVPYLKNSKQLEKEELQKKKGRFDTEKGGKMSKKKKERKRKKKRTLKKIQLRRVICPACRGYYSYNTYSQHFSKKHGDVKSQNTRTLLAAVRRELDEYSGKASLELVRYVLPYLSDDEIGLLCRHDELIIEYGNKFIEQLLGDDQAKQVKSHMRLMGKVLLKMRAVNSRITDLFSAFEPHYFDSFMRAAEIICKINKKVVGVPFNAHTIRLLWNRLFEILDAKFSKIEEYKDRKIAKDKLACYMSSFKNEYLSKIGSKAQRAENINRRMKAVVIDRPDSNDIRIYYKFLLKKRNDHLDHLLNDYDDYHYFQLMQCEVVLLMIFNGRRPGETDRTRLQNFLHRQITDENDEFFQTLNSKEKEQAIKFEKMICQGKKINGIDCAVYLTQTDVEALNVLVKYRSEAKVHIDNEYLFALADETTGRMRHIDAYTSNINLVQDCQVNYKPLKKPHLIRSTKCRSQLATLFSTVGDQGQVDNIAHHLAHTRAVHFSHYRKSVINNDVNVTQFFEERLQIQDTSQSNEGKLMSF